MLPTPNLPMIQFLSWLARQPRTHTDVLDAWQSSCPRLSVWEDAVIDGFARHAGDTERHVVLTPLGHAVLDAETRRGDRLAAD